MRLKSSDNVCSKQCHGSALPDPPWLLAVQPDTNQISKFKDSRSANFLDRDDDDDIERI